ncbi:hypothetical protein LCGC14_1787510 [marine sediment metagenome]|uniref:Uncharacterized protein n=1 Tax=marine sediment metagenome TaxID=412755 RepID=A0A0F9HG44_9ZZZZ
MKLWELANGILTPLSEEENDLLEKFLEDENCELNEREEIVAQKLVSKSVLIREDKEDCDKFRVNYRVDVWRD